MLTSKTVLITGGSSGIGKSIAVRFAAAGARIAVVASSSLTKAQIVVDEIRAAGGSAEAYTADVTNSAAVRTLVADVEARQGPVNILVTSAGMFEPNPVDTGAGAVFDRTIDLNVKGTFHCIEAVIPGMKAAGEGRIICLSSGTDRVGVGSFSAYCASKAAVSMLCRALALELAPLNININAIAPGNTTTPMNEGMRHDPDQAGHLNSLAAATPSVRTFSKPEDIAELALFMASPAGRAMHGSAVLIDEGITAGIRL